MTANFYGIPSNILVGWILNFEFNEKIKEWVDLGCGNGEYLCSIGVVPNKGIAVDVSDKISDLPKGFIYENSSINEWLEKNKERRFSLVTMFDLVEHFPKEEVFNLIEKINKITDFLLITTPSGFLRQDAETHPEFANNPYLWHRSGFSPEDFEQKEFLVFILKKYHYKPQGNNRSFDKLVVIKTSNLSFEEKKRISRNLVKKALVYNLNPLYLYRTIRDVFVRIYF